ncbi:TPA: helix-turn-helix transcriptional regulator [Streptococcus pyogenes]|uniref:XRE family transcriptional regulator n=1 Tax=Streptococcus pyogenes TaxID=1314 RepID=UPI000315E213|nr:helix-turn-helix transcriptional regulator [Streptococcus pyogenes]HER4572124.1 helix-turn-helix transcriptional regulator [Streptococcus pyogenes NGAS641]HER4601563.1 helix-turn-helix transcriptional regulator [Streptococcus pyogenes NGAS625]HER4629733.1 helix-turn-helix transcriptional regulator [Streptococcus pyogenes NGAS599]HER4700734.1 helix-turn-helix transcriptional regulator [Streptococcus pyogenes NGAS322]AKZ50514.1 XRE family transcriptional regulator [Streptococcus pyogenes]
MKLGEIIKNFREEKKLSMDRFAEKSGLTKGYISMLEKNEHPKSKKPIIPTEETLLKVAKGMGVDIDFVLSKLDSDQEIQINISPKNMLNMDNPSTPTNPQVELIPSTLQKINSTSSQLEHSRQIIVLDTAETLLEQQKEIKNNEDTIAELFSYNYYDHAASAGTGQYLNDVQVEKIELPVDYDADFVIPVYGDSMEPKYHSGDYVFVKLSVELTDGDIGVFEYYGDAYIKQLLINDEGAFLHSLNQCGDYPDIPIDRDSDFRIIGEVMGSYRER